MALSVVALTAIGERPDAEWAGPEKLVFWALMRGADHGQVYVRDERGITQLTDLPDIRELWRLDHPLFAFQSFGRGGIDIHFLNVDTAARKTVVRLAGNVYKVPSPDGQRIIGDESGLLVVSSLQGNAPARILGRSPGFSMAWNCAGDAVYFGQNKDNRIIRVDVDSGERKDLTPSDWPDLVIYYFSLSCDERVLAVVDDRGGLHIYQDMTLVKKIRATDLLEPYVSRDGATIVYLLPYDDDTSRVMSYDMATGETRELIGPIAAFGPVFPLEER